MNFTVVDVEIDAVEGDDAGEGFADAVHAQGGGPCGGVARRSGQEGTRANVGYWNVPDR